MKRALVGVLLGLLGCSKAVGGLDGGAPAPHAASPQRGRAVAAAVPVDGALAAGARVEAGTTPVVAGSALGFDAAGWRRVACSDVKPGDGCASQWVNDTGQVARVFVVRADPAALPGFVDKLAAGVKKRGGVVDRIPQGLRFLEQVGDRASLNYALVGPGAVYLVTSVVPLTDQRADDERLRNLLDSARRE